MYVCAVGRGVTLPFHQNPLTVLTCMFTAGVGGAKVGLPYSGFAVHAPLRPPVKKALQRLADLAHRDAKLLKGPLRSKRVISCGHVTQPGSLPLTAGLLLHRVIRRSHPLWPWSLLQRPSLLLQPHVLKLARYNCISLLG